jgi:hypothetical protein
MHLSAQYALQCFKPEFSLLAGLQESFGALHYAYRIFPADLKHLGPFAL